MTFLDRRGMVLRLGFYVGLASRELGDDSYTLYLGHAEQITEEAYLEMVQEISTRLIAAGKLRPDEDAFETFLKNKVQYIEIDE